MTIEDIIKAQYNMVVERWKIESKYLKRLPLKDSDYKEMMNEAGNLSETRKGESQDYLCKRINAMMDEIAYIDRKYKEGKNDKE